MDSEETPLLAPPTDAITKHELVYTRFTDRRKRGIVALVSLCGIIPLFVAGSFIPSIPDIAKDLDSTGSVVSLAVSLSMFAASFGSLSAASYSTFYGRRPVYLCALPLLCIGSLGVASARSIPQLMGWRFVQAFGSAPGLSVGAGVIGDIYKLEERGQAMGFFFAACLLGPALAPPIGGLAARYASWRFMQLALGITGLVAFTCILLFFPETSHPGVRGIDKLRENEDEEGKRLRWRHLFVNPLGPLWLLRSPNLMAVSIGGLLILFTDYVLLVPLAYTIGVRYNITNAALIGACFLPCGLGNMIGAPLAGRISDRIVVQWRAKRGGVWYPEDRLRATLFGAAVLVPISVLASGLITQFIPGTVGLVLNLVCLFMNGVGVRDRVLPRSLQTPMARLPQVDIVLSPSAAYVVDVMHARSAESMAANNGFRSMLMSLLIATILPLINSIGVAATNASSALLAWVGFGIIWYTIRYGNQMRAWIDVGYSTAENN